MTVVRRIPYENRLAKLIRLPGGKRMSEAIADAGANLAEMQDETAAALDALVDRIQAVAAAGGPIDAIYDASNEIITLSTALENPELGRAAHSLCELVDGSPKRGWDREAIEVHVNSLRLLRRGDMPAAAREKILSGLDAVVKRVVGAPKG